MVGKQTLLSIILLCNYMKAIAQNGIEFFLKRGKHSKKCFRLTFAMQFNILNIRKLKHVVVQLQKSKNQFLKLGNVAKKELKLVWFS